MKISFAIIFSLLVSTGLMAQQRPLPKSTPAPHEIKVERMTKREELSKKLMERKVELRREEHAKAKDRKQELKSYSK
jgi:hypothetical protein